MEILCSLKFSSTAKAVKDLQSDIAVWFRRFAVDDPSSTAKLIDNFKTSYQLDAPSNIKIDNFNKFFHTIEDMVCLLDYNSPETLSYKAREFLKVIYDLCTSESAREQITPFYRDINNAGVTDETKLAEMMNDLESSISDIYGYAYYGLYQDLTTSFSAEIKLNLIYDQNRALIFEYNRKQVNDEIIKYKEEKYRNLVNFLQSKGLCLDCSKELYHLSGYLNIVSYRKVMNTFKEYIDNISDLPKQLDELNFNKQNNKQAAEQQTLYEKLILKMEEDPQLKKAIDASNDTLYKKGEYKLLYVGGKFSSYFNVISRLVKNYAKNNPDSELTKELENILSNILNPAGSFLEVVLDYIKLNNFDQLLEITSGEYFGYNHKLYSTNLHTASKLDLKYEIRQSHKHENAGFETKDKENTESHTGTTIKSIISDLHIYNIYDPNQPTTRSMSLNILISAWLSLIWDIIDGNVHNISKKQKENILNLLNDTSNPVDSIFKVLDELFKLRSDKGGGRFRRINRITGFNKFTDEAKNILFSFYEQVTSLRNNSSIASLEKFICNKSKSGVFYPITTNLIGILIRNVHNAFLDTNLYGRDKSVGIKKEFNWNSDLFDIVEGCVYSSKMRQRTLVGVEERLELYKYELLINLATGNLSASIKIGNKDLRMVAKKGSYGFFEDTILLGIDFKELLANVNLQLFIRKKLNNDTLDLDELLFNDLLNFIEYYLQLDLSSEEGLNVLSVFSKNVKNNKETPGNYLEALTKLAFRTMSIDYIANVANKNNQSLGEFLEDSNNPNNIYNSMYIQESSKEFSNIIEIEGKKVYLIPFDLSNPYILEFARSKVISEGRSVKSTSKSKAGNSVANYTISRLGSELRLSIHAFKNDPEFVGKSLIFISNDDILTKEPIVDSEITTLAGQVVNVSDATTTELFQHAILDKFYLKFIGSATDEICFLPTTYADKLLFLNYTAKVLKDADGKSYMNFATKNFEVKFKELYRDTFFKTHALIYKRSYEKICKLFGIDIPSSGAAMTALHSVNVKLLLEKVRQYNETHPYEQIALELDKDYRVRTDRDGKQICDLNEVSSFYSSLSTNSGAKALDDYFAKLKALFVKELKNSAMNLALFNSTSELERWKRGGKVSSRNYLLNILSSDKILNTIDRAAYTDKWIDANTGEMIISDANGNLNPFFERFFYIEGLYSNNLRLLLTGTEVNHPDKASNTKNAKLGTIYDKLLTANPKAFLKILEDNDIDTTDVDMNELTSALVNEVKSVDDLNYLANYSKKLNAKTKLVLGNIYYDSIISIINTAQGTLFKRNVIGTATLLHLTLGRVDGSASLVLAAVIMDEKAPVHNLRESDSIDASDGSARMSPIQVILENNCLDEQRVGTNRKPIWGDITSDLTLFEAKFAAFGITNELMLQSLDSTSSMYRMFKKMHSIRWNGSIDLTHSIYLTADASPMSELKYNLWFSNNILNNNKLYYKNKNDEVIEIYLLNADIINGQRYYYTLEKNSKSENYTKVYHLFDNNSDHFMYTEEELNQLLSSGVNTQHTIDTLFELYTALGGVYSCNEVGQGSEFNLQVLTNYVINVGYLKSDKVLEEDDGDEDLDVAKDATAPTNREIITAADVVLPLKNKFIAYAFNNTAVKCGAKNVNPSSSWQDDTPLLTFTVGTKGLGIQLNADHSVDESELTEFSLVIAACAAYGKDFNSINEIYFGLGKSAFEESKYEITNIMETLFPKQNELKAKYKLYTLIGRLIISNRSNSDLDLTTEIKQEVDKIFLLKKDEAGNELKLPFSDFSLYNLFITVLTSIVNSKSIKRKHPGSGYVMVPGYNVIQYYQIFDAKTKKYERYMFEDVTRLAKKDYRGKLIQIATEIAGGEAIKVGVFNRKLVTLDTKTIEDYINQNLDKLSTITNTKALEAVLKYQGITTNDPTLYNKALVNIYLEGRLAAVPFSDKGYFMPTDNIDILDETGNLIHTFNTDAMDDYYRFKLQPIVKEVTEKKYNVTIVEQSNGKIRIKLNEYINKDNPDLDLEFVLERNWKSKDLAYNIHFRTGELGPSERRILSANQLSVEEKNRLFSAAIERLPIGATLNMSPTTEKQIETGIGGLSYLSIKGFNSINPNQEELYALNNLTLSEKELEDKNARLLSRVGGASLVVDGYTKVRYFNLDGKVKETFVGKYKKVAQEAPYKYRLNVTKAVNLKPSLIRWKYKDEEGNIKFMNIYDHPIISNNWSKDKEDRPTRAQIQEVLDNLDNGFFEINGVRYDLIENSLENTEAEIVLGDMYLSIFGTEGYSLQEVLEQGEDFFKKQVKIPTAPKGVYDLAFVKSSGESVLVSLGNLPYSNSLVEVKHNISQESINDDNEIYYNNLKIGKYVEDKNWKIAEREDGTLYVLNAQDNIVDPSRYLIVNPNDPLTRKVLKRVNFIQEYLYSKVENVLGHPLEHKYTLYRIAPHNEITDALEKPNMDGMSEEEQKKAKAKINADAFRLLSSLVKHLYKLDEYSDILINTNNSKLFDKEKGEKERQYLAGCLLGFTKLYKKGKDGKYVELDAKELGKLDSFTQHMNRIVQSLNAKDSSFQRLYNKEIEDFYVSQNNAHSKYISFLNSLRFISSRIPAQSLQSFMPMKCVGWTKNNSNTAYVSYIQTFLQGSDYKDYFRISLS